MSKLQELQRELRYADQAKVSTAQLKRRLNDIIAQTADADVTYKSVPTTISVPHYMNFEFNTWEVRRIEPQSAHKFVKQTTNPLTGKTVTQDNPLGTHSWWDAHLRAHNLPAARVWGDLDNKKLYAIQVSNFPTSEQNAKIAQRYQSAASTRENLISKLMNSKEFKDAQYLTNLRIVPDERKRKFRPRMYDVSSNLTVKSDPRLLVNMVNNLKNAMKKRGGTSSAPVSRSGSDFFANILRRGEG